MASVALSLSGASLLIRLSWLLSCPLCSPDGPHNASKGGMGDASLVSRYRKASTPGILKRDKRRKRVLVSGELFGTLWVWWAGQPNCWDPRRLEVQSYQIISPVPKLSLFELGYPA